MSRYANNTSVTVDRSMIQVRQVIIKGGGDGVAIAETVEGAAVRFIFDKKAYKFVIKYPLRSQEDIAYSGNGRSRTKSQVDSAIENEKKRLWRAMWLYIKAAIEAHNNHLIDLNKSLMSHMLLPSGKTVYEKVYKNLDQLDVSPQILLN